MNFHSDEFISKEVAKRHNQMKELYPMGNIIATYYKGSANYLLDDENSGIDTISLGLPSFDDIVEDHPVEAREVNFPNGIGSVVDIRKFCFKLLKQCRNEMELLYTNYLFVEPLYSDIFVELRGNSKPIEENHKISSIYISLAIASSFEKKFAESLTKAGGYDQKALSNFIREISFCMNLIEGKSYHDSMIANDSIISPIKKGILSQSGAVQTFDIYQYLKKDIEHTEIPQLWKEPNEKAKEVIHNFAKNCFYEFL